MDNLCHTLCGLALARAGLDRTGPLVTPVLAVAANLPDADVVLSLEGHLRYLHDHRGVTHALPGMAVEAPLIALAAYGLGRLERVEGLRFGPLLLAAVVGLLSHLGLDALNSYGVRPLLPFSEARFFGDAAYIVDPWLWLAFGAAAWLGAERGPRLAAVWTGLALVAVFVVGASGHSVGAVTGLFALGALAVGLAKHTPLARRPLACARVGLAVALVYVGALLAASHLARERGLAALAPLHAGEPLLRSSVSPAPGVPWRAAVVAETPTRILDAEVDLIAGTARPGFAMEKHLDDPAVARLGDAPEVRVWRFFARHPFVARSAEGALVLGDARYDTNARASWCNIAVAPR